MVPHILYSDDCNFNDVTQTLKTRRQQSRNVIFNNHDDDADFDDDAGYDYDEEDDDESSKRCFFSSSECWIRSLAISLSQSLAIRFPNTYATPISVSTHHHNLKSMNNTFPHLTWDILLLNSGTFVDQEWPNYRIATADVHFFPFHSISLHLFAFHLHFNTFQCILLNWPWISVLQNYATLSWTQWTSTASTINTELCLIGDLVAIKCYYIYIWQPTFWDFHSALATRGHNSCTKSWQHDQCNSGQLGQCKSLTQQINKCNNQANNSVQVPRKRDKYICSIAFMHKTKLHGEFDATTHVSWNWISVLKGERKGRGRHDAVTGNGKILTSVQ